ncbi:hypothetical protein PMIN04_011064 [Paraphaeosphaeria minitans]
MRPRLTQPTSHSLRVRQRVNRLGSSDLARPHARPVDLFDSHDPTSPARVACTSPQLSSSLTQTRSLCDKESAVMAPAGKRKRGDRSYSYDEEHSNRPSPHRPQNLTMASPQQNNSPRGGRRGSRGRGGYINNGAHHSGSAQQSPTTMQPPANIPQQTAPRPAPATPSRSPAPPKEPPFKPASRGVPESNEYLTPERVLQWNAAARSAVVQAAMTAQQAGDGFNLNMVFFEIIHAAGEGLMSPAELGSVVRDIVTAPTDDLIDPVVHFLDCISSYAELDPKREDFKKTQPIQHLLIATEIDPNQMRRQLEEKLLEQTELVRGTFHVKGVRATTKAMYQQANYNLLREETEGYSKLMTEYFTTVNSEPPRHDVVSDTFERVNALIGTFDLDVGRVLDVTLDVFANLLVKHYKFFIKYLRVSTWWPTQLGTDNVEWQEPDVKTLPNWALPTSQNWYYTDEEKEEQLRLRELRDVKFWQRVKELGERNAIKAFFELGARPITRTLRESDKSNTDPSLVSKKSATQEWVGRWIEETGTLPPLGNEVAAQLLGFKLQFYASSLRDPSDVLPDNLIYLAALLIKIGFISITDLWEHLYPQAEDLEKLQAKLKAEKEEKEAKRKGKTANALTMAGALSDDTPAVPAVFRLRDAENKPSSKPETERNTPAQSDEEHKPALPEPVDQKVALLRSLLCIGAIPEALFILGTNKWMLELYPDLHSHIFRLAHHSLSKVYEASRPVPPNTVPISTKGAIPNAATRASEYVPRRTLRWAKPELKDAGDGIDYRFYWDDWADNVPVCQSVDDVFLLCQSWLGMIGPECGRDVLLLTKLARIGRKNIIDDSSAQNMKRWSDLLATFLVPALTFTGENPGAVNEMWELLKRFDTATRYTIYHQWEQSFKPVMKTAFAEVIYKTNQILNRVANTNQGPMGRAIAKLANACPVKVFKQTLERGQQYVNMIKALVRCSHYLTELGYDCLTYSLVVQITAGNKPTTQSDGMLTEGWLKNAASFVGQVYKEYSKYMDPKPILEYISTQLLNREGELFVMKVFEELITHMGGVKIPGVMAEAKVIALFAGPRLRKFTLKSLSDDRYSGGVQKSAERLMNHFRESGLAAPILIALADQVQAYLYRENQRQVPDKVVLFNYDNLKLSFIQFLDFLRHQLSTEEFDEQIPGLVELMSEYYLDTDLAFQISRDSITAKANDFRLQSRAAVENASGGDAIMEDVTQTESGISKGTPAVAADSTGDVEMGEARTFGTISGDQTKPHEDLVKVPKSNAEIDTLVSKLKATLPERFGSHACLPFLVTFWQLSLKDVQDPKMALLKRLYQDAKDSTFKDATKNDGRRTNTTVDKIREARAEADQFMIEFEEFDKQSQLIQSSLQEEMHFWFSEVPSMDPTLHMTLLQDCFLARARMSLQDAQFSASMMFFMHKSNVPKFRLIKLLDDLFNTGRLSAMFFSMSEDESKNVGRFMNDILQELGRWHSSERIYKQFECVKVFNDEGRPKNPESFLKYSEFRLLLGKWHNKIHDALHGCLRHGEPGDKNLKQTAQYTELRNSINILKAVAPSFPRMRENATSLQEDLIHYADEKMEERADIRVAATSLQSEFIKRQKTLRSHTMFVTGKEDPKESTPTRAATPASKTNDHDTGSKKLSASAQAFQPKPSTTNGITSSASEKSGSDERKPTHPTSSMSRMNGNDMARPSRASEQSASSQFPGRDNAKRLGPGPGSASANNSPVPPRPDSRGGYQAQQSSRAGHNLPTRPDTQPLRPRPSDRPGHPPVEYNQSHGRHETRTNVPGEYGRLERPGAPRGRSASPGRHSRPMSQERVAAIGDRPEWAGREAREYEDRVLRGPPVPRDARGGPLDRNAQYADSLRDHRDNRDQRDYRARDSTRERTDSRGPVPLPTTPADSRGRPHAGSNMTPNDTTSHRRDALGHHNERGPLPPRPTMHVDTPGPSVNPARAALIEQGDSLDRGPPPRSAYSKDDRINPERAAFMPEDRNRNTPVRLDRDSRDPRAPFDKDGDRHGRDGRSSFIEGDRHVRDSRAAYAKEDQIRTPSGRPDRDVRPDERDMRRGPGSDRHDERPPAAYYGNHNRPDYRDERSQAQPYPNSRDRRDEFSSNAPTGPRSGRDGSSSSHVSREMFQPSQPSRPVASRQDPTYGRLNQPAESIPSGPRNPSSDSRDVRSHPSTSNPNTTPVTPQSTGVHPSRMGLVNSFDSARGPTGPPPPPLQTDISNAPSGPRSSGRTPLPSPSTRGPPTGPAGPDRHVRRQDSRTALGAINNVLAQSGQTQGSPPAAPAPAERSGERSHRKSERSRDDERKGDERSREKRDSSRRDRSEREPRTERDGSHRERSDRDRRGDDRKKDDRERDRKGEKRLREPTDQPHGETKRSRR